ncbi:SAM-dependent methyltransferase, partial [Streptomyces sp. SID8499]|uniref:SAM-dependent methyltransferase n=1 Tax=Streptomyces sp. SID8499 TaxID=2706106 RepID=UPI0013CD11C9
ADRLIPAQRPPPGRRLRALVLRRRHGPRRPPGGRPPYFLRPVEDVEGFFAGLEPVPPGLEPVPLWRPGPAAEGAPGAPRPIGRHGGLGRKP